jgi:hypothetical protein
MDAAGLMLRTARKIGAMPKGNLYLAQILAFPYGSGIDSLDLAAFSAHPRTVNV